MKIDLQHVAMMVAAPAATAFVDYLVNSGQALTWATVGRAATATVLVVVALAKKSFLGGAQ